MEMAIEKQQVFVYVSFKQSIKQLLRKEKKKQQQQIPSYPYCKILLKF